MDLRSKFKQAADFLPSVAGNLKTEHLLQFYSLYKQANHGKCNTSRPNWYAFEAKQKWDAWNSLGDLSSEEAMSKYISLLNLVVPDWESQHPGSWVSVSRMKNEDDLDECDKDIFDRVKDGDIEKLKIEDIEDINVLDDEGMGLIHWAADRGNEEIVKCILELGADVNLKDATGQTALHYACACGHKNVVEMLLTKSADKNIACNEGFLPVDLADDKDIKTLLKIP